MSVRVDPLTQVLTPDRVYYATGMMLGAEDFTAEQVYHRLQLARALAYLHGAGTVVGLRVTYEAATQTQPERLRVRPGLAIDRLGRLIEVSRAWCIRLADWFAAQSDSGLRPGYHEGVVIPVADDSADPPVTTATSVSGVVADVFLTFHACPNGLTPSFQAGPFDALDAVSPARVRDGFALELVLRDDADPKVPLPPGDFAGIDDHGARACAVRKGILDQQPFDPLTREQEHKLDQDPASLFLARVVIPADPGPPVTRRAEPVAVDNYSRQFVRSTPALGLFVGL